MRYNIKKYIIQSLIAISWIVLITVLSFLFYALFHYETELFGYVIVNPYFEFVDRLPLWIYSVLFFSFTSILSVVVFICLSLYFSLQRSITAKLRLKYYNFFSYILSNYFFIDFYKENERRVKLINKIGKYLNGNIRLISFIQAFLKIQETVTLNLSDDFKYIINKLDLHSDIESLINNIDFDVRILAMKMLSYLENHSYDKKIIKLGRSNNFAVRTEAYTALVRKMEKDEHLVNFIGEKHNLSLLDINVIVNAVLKNKKMKVDYNSLLYSQNPKKIMIGLILAKHKYKDCKICKIPILTHVGSSVEYFSQLAWEALFLMLSEEDLLYLVMEKFEYESDNVKLIILKKMKDFVSLVFYEFIKKIIFTQSLLVKVEAMKIIFINDFNSLVLYEDSEDEEIKMAYKEVACVYN